MNVDPTAPSRQSPADSAGPRTRLGRLPWCGLTSVACAVGYAITLLVTRRDTQLGEVLFIACLVVGFLGIGVERRRYRWVVSVLGIALLVLVLFVALSTGSWGDPTRT